MYLRYELYKNVNSVNVDIRKYFYVLVWRLSEFAFFVRLLRWAHFLFFTMAVVTNIILLYKEGADMPDYKQLYLTLLDGVEKAIENLKNVEIACEEIYIDTDETQE